MSLPRLILAVTIISTSLSAFGDNLPLLKALWGHQEYKGDLYGNNSQYCTLPAFAPSVRLGDCEDVYAQDMPGSYDVGRLCENVVAVDTAVITPVPPVLAPDRKQSTATTKVTAGEVAQGITACLINPFCDAYAAIGFPFVAITAPFKHASEKKKEQIKPNRWAVASILKLVKDGDLNSPKFTAFVSAVQTLAPTATTTQVMDILKANIPVGGEICEFHKNHAVRRGDWFYGEVYSFHYKVKNLDQLTRMVAKSIK